MEMDSKFPNEIDTFKFYRDPEDRDIPKIKQWKYLRDKQNKSESERKEYEKLTKEVATFLFASTDLNKMCSAMVNLEKYFLNHSKDDLDKWNKQFNDNAKMSLESFNSNYVDKYNNITNIKNEFESFCNVIKNQIQEKAGSFSFNGNYQEGHEYKKGNIVTNPKNKGLYIALKDGQFPISDTNAWSLMMENQKGETGEKGDPGSNLVFKGEWSPSHSYSKNDLVTHLGNVYVCKIQNLKELEFSESNWDMLLSGNSSSSITFDLESLALSLKATYVFEENNEKQFTEKIVDNSQNILISCVTTINENKITSIYDNSKFLLGKDKTITVVVDLNNNSTITKRV